MKTYDKKQIPATTQTFVKTIKCDVCGKTTDSRGWKDGTFDATKTEVSLETGSNYPEGGHGEITEIDICPPCFIGKLIPWVEAQGGSPTTKEWEW